MRPTAFDPSIETTASGVYTETNSEEIKDAVGSQIGGFCLNIDQGRCIKYGIQSRGSLRYFVRMRS